mgnify:CR=1 FL=1
MYWSAMKFIQKINQFGPVPLQGCDILPFADRLGLKSDFAKPSAFMPVKEEKAVESSYGGLCAIMLIFVYSEADTAIFTGGTRIVVGRCIFGIGIR